MVKTILDLCGGTGSWSLPYRKPGYEVIVVDPAAEMEGSIKTRVQDADLSNIMEVHGILAAPPCTEFAASGARWWGKKAEENPELLDEAVDNVLACLRIVKKFKPKWWCLENPVGRLSQIIGPPVATIEPYYYGDPWAKRTCLWGYFTLPRWNIVPVVINKSFVNSFGETDDRAALRSITPPGFAKAFCRANP